MKFTTTVVACASFGLVMDEVSTIRGSEWIKRPG